MLKQKTKRMRGTVPAVSDTSPVSAVPGNKCDSINASFLAGFCSRPVGKGIESITKFLKSNIYDTVQFFYSA